MAALKHTEILPYVHPDDPAGYLKPGDTLMAGGYDFAWCYVWYKEVPGYPGRCVGSNGSLWSLKISLPNQRAGEWIRAWGTMTKRGYLRVSLSEKGVGRHILIHDLVLEVFLYPCPPGKECRHLNGKRADNRLFNLWWGSNAENLEDKIRHGNLPMGERVWCAKLTDEDVMEIRRLASDGITNKKIAKLYGIKPISISNIIHGKNWKHLEFAPGTKSFAGSSRSIGPDAFNAKLDEVQVKEIRRLLAAGGSHRQIAKKYGVTHSIIYGIKTGKRWKQVDAMNGEAIVVRPPPKDRRSNATLYPEQVREILALDKQGISRRDLMSRFDVSKSTIGEILRGETWKEIPRP